MARHPGPQQYPFQRGDRIRVSNRSSVTTANKVFVRVRYEDGDKDRFEIPITHAGDRANEISFSPDTFLRDGFVEALTVDTGIVARGECYLAIQVDNENELLHYQIFAGYVTPLHTPLGFFEHMTDGEGLIVNNEAPSTLVNNTALTRTIAVPTNARWRLYGGVELNADDVARVVTVEVTDTAANRLFKLAVISGAAGSRQPYPNNEELEDNFNNMPILLAATDEIRITWAAGGASAGGTAESSANVEEWITP